MDEPSANDTANPLPPLSSVPPIAPSTTADDPPPADTPNLIDGSTAKPKQRQRRDSLRSGLVMPKQPSELSKYGSERANEFRRALEDACIASHGSPISPVHASLILSAAGWLRSYLHISERMRRDYSELSARDWLEFVRAAGHASNERDRAIRLLDLNTERPRTITLPPLPAPRQPYNASNYIPCDVAESNKIKSGCGVPAHTLLHPCAASSGNISAQSG